MPNWCVNELTVTGSVEELKKLTKKVKGEKEDLDFNKIKPTPEDLEKLDAPSNLPLEKSKILIEKYGFDNWYDWQVNNWSVKWGASNSRLDDTLIDKGVIRYEFDTAWNEPHEFLISLSQVFPSLRFRLKYYETGMCFGGITIYKNGEVVSGEYYENDKFWDWLKEEEPEFCKYIMGG